MTEYNGFIVVGENRDNVDDYYGPFPTEESAQEYISNLSDPKCHSDHYVEPLHQV